MFKVLPAQETTSAEAVDATFNSRNIEAPHDGKVDPNASSAPTMATPRNKAATSFQFQRNQHESMTSQIKHFIQNP